MVWAAVVIMAAVLGVRYWMMGASADPIALSVLERDGRRCKIAWNHSAKPVAAATTGSLDIVDGADPLAIKLTRQDLSAGKFTYVRRTGDIQVKLTVQDPSGAKSEESSIPARSGSGRAAPNPEANSLKTRKSATICKPKSTV